MADANSSPIHCANSALISNIKGLADPFMREKILNNNATPTDNSDDNFSVLAWRACADATCDEREKYGSPYLLFDLDGAHPRIVSMGADGKYGGVNKTIPDTTAPDVCLPSTKNLDGTKNDTGLDDLVLCLK
jgi:hypothetical protein